MLSTTPRAYARASRAGFAKGTALEAPGKGGAFPNFWEPLRGLDKEVVPNFVSPSRVREGAWADGKADAIRDAVGDRPRLSGEGEACRVETLRHQHVFAHVHHVAGRHVRDRRS